MPKRAIVLIAEIDLEDGQTVPDRLDAFREATLPAQAGILLYRPGIPELFDHIAATANDGGPYVEAEAGRPVDNNEGEDTDDSTTAAP